MWILAIWWEENSEKNGKCKSDRHWLTKCTKRYEEKLRYRVIHIMQRECRRVSCNTEKERKISLILTLKSWKFWVPDLGFFKKFARQRIERSEARGTARAKLKDLESLGWEALNPKFSPQKPKNWLTSPNNNFSNPVFHEALSKTKI